MSGVDDHGRPAAGTSASGTAPVTYQLVVKDSAGNLGIRTIVIRP